MQTDLRQDDFAIAWKTIVGVLQGHSSRRCCLVNVDRHVDRRRKRVAERSAPADLQRLEWLQHCES